MEIIESKLAFYNFEINNLNFKFRLKMFIALKKLEKNVKKCDKEIHHVAIQLVTSPNSMLPFADNFTRQGLNTTFQLLAVIAFANVYEQITATDSTSTPKRKI